MKKAVSVLLGVLMCLFLVLPVSAEQSASLPNDPKFGEQWALEAIEWLPVWQQGFTGKGVKIGIVDSGAYISHEDLQGANIQGYSFNKTGIDTSESFSNDVIGHGTFVTGMIAAQPNNETGIVGIAPDAEIYAYRAFTSRGGSIEAVVHAIDQAIADGCRILNLSMGALNDDADLRQAVQKAQQAGILIVCAAGNNSSKPTQIYYPAAYDGVIGVGSVNQQLERSDFSVTNNTVFVVAPGENLVGLKHNNAVGYKEDGEGTSFAAPIITALAALALEYDPTLTAEEITEMLRLTAVDLGAPGYDTSYGYGLVNCADFIAGFTGPFSVQYTLSAGELPENAPLTYRPETGIAQLPVPTRENYTFAGWYADPARTQPVTQIPAGNRGEVVLYDSWTAAVNQISGYQEGLVHCLVKDPAQVLVAAYDQQGRLIDLAQAEIAPNTESLPLWVDESAFRIRVFLGAKDSLLPLCEAWDSLSVK